MWPKLLAQLFEVLPHVSRLLPLADRFFQGRASSDEANRRAVESMGESLRADLGKVTGSHTGLYRQLNEQSEKLSSLTVEMNALKASAETTDLRVARLEEKLTANARLLMVVLFLNFVLVGMVLFLSLQHK